MLDKLSPSNYPQQIGAIALFNQNNRDRGQGRVSKLNQCSDPNLSQPPATSLTATLVQCPIQPLERRIKPTHLVTLQ